MKLPGYLVCLALALAMAPPASAEPLPTPGMQGLGDTRHHRFESERLGHPLQLLVRAPDSAPGRRLPTVYLLDGGINYPLLSAYYHYLRLGEELPELILVGISYGSDRFEEGNYRSSDFTAPSPEREWWGKASVFQAVLETELLPLIEASYPSDPERRILVGHSLAGQFVLFNALTRPDLFEGLIATNPALHRNLDWFLSWQGEAPMPIDATRLFLAQGELDDVRFREPVRAWLDRWSGAAVARPFVLEFRELAGHTHLSAATAAFRQGLAWLLAEPTGPTASPGLENPEMR